MTISIPIRRCDPKCAVILAHHASAGTVAFTDVLRENAISHGFELAKSPKNLCLYPHLNAFKQEGMCFILRKKES